MKTGDLHSREQIRAIFKRTHLPKQKLEEVVDRYMSKSPVPPRWSAVGVRGTFGNTIYRLWSRKIKNRHHVGYFAGNTLITPAVQSIHDFGLKTTQNLVKEKIAPPMIFDEAHYFSSGKQSKRK